MDTDNGLFTVGNKPTASPQPLTTAQDHNTAPEKTNTFTDTSDVEKAHSLPDSTSKLSEKESPCTPAPISHAKKSAYASLGWLDRLLALWILLAIIIGLVIGNFAPDAQEVLNRGKFVQVSVPIAIGLLVMMYPILCKVKYETLHLVFAKKEVWRQLAFSVFMNWIVAPFLMLGLAWAFLPDAPELRVGLILVGLARCIAMVLIWTGIAGGDEEYCAILVAVNSILQMVLYAPLALLFVAVISDDESFETVPYSTVATSVGVFLGIPLAAAILTRGIVRTISPKFYDEKLLKILAPFSLLGLLYTILILFASQGEHVVSSIVSVVRVAAPLIVYFIIIFFFTLYVCHRMGFGYKLSTTQSFTAASNNFELAIAVAVSLFGPGSQEALATTVGPLVEVPVLLGLVYAVRWVAGRRGWRD